MILCGDKIASFLSYYKLKFFFIIFIILRSQGTL